MILKQKKNQKCFYYLKKYDFAHVKAITNCNYSQLTLNILNVSQMNILRSF